MCWTVASHCVGPMGSMLISPRSRPWCVEGAVARTFWTARISLSVPLTANPLAGLPKVEETEPARKRRPLTEDEIAKLVKAARERPLRDALTVRVGKNKGKLLAKVREEVRERLKRTGQERALLYRFMILTGLLFDVPSDFNRVFDGDLDAAGIPKTDAQGRTLDIHPDVHRDHTFATGLARNGTSPAVAQKLMRHSPSTSLRAVSLSNGDIRLTTGPA